MEKGDDSNDEKTKAKNQKKNEKYNKDLDINSMIMHGNIQLQPQRNQNDLLTDITGKKKIIGGKKAPEGKRIERGNKKKKHEPVNKTTTTKDGGNAKIDQTDKAAMGGLFGDSDNDRIERELNGSSGSSEVEDAKSVKPNNKKKQQKRRQSSDEDDDKVFSDRDK